MRKIVLLGVGVFFLIQLLRVDKNEAPLDSDSDFLELSNAPNEIKEMIQSACYDCHSNNTKYPWYSEIAPVSWYINHHIEEAKEHLNFSIWNSYSLKKANHKLEECYEEIERHKMPTSDYVMMHKEAKLTEDQTAILIQWFKNQMR